MYKSNNVYTICKIGNYIEPDQRHHSDIKNTIISHFTVNFE